MQELLEHFVPCIFDGPAEKACLSAGYNAVIIKIDGGLRADLNWKQAREKAQTYLEQGFALFWEIDLGLFSNLTLPLTNQGQYLSLSLSLDHFRDELYKEFAAHTVGLAIYRGEADFSADFKWDDHQIQNFQEWLKEAFIDEKQFELETGLPGSWLKHLDLNSLLQIDSGKRLASLFCRDVAIEYMRLLTNRLPDTLSRYLLLDARSISHSLLWQAQLLNAESFEHLQLAVQGASLPLQVLKWEQEDFIEGYIGSKELSHQSMPEVKVGICLPPIERRRPSQYQGLEEALQLLMQKEVAFRLIPENHLITEWDGLDDLIYVPDGLSSQGKRKLQGFCAAGGCVVTLGDSIGLDQEINFKKWIEDKSF